MKLFNNRSWSLRLQTVLGASRSVFLALILLFCLLASQVSDAIIDNNNNDISDLWEMEYYSGQLLPGNYDLQTDPDGDGWTMFKEAAAGTDPFNANPPGGFILPQVEYIPAVYLNSTSGGAPTMISPEVANITWTTLYHKQYTLEFSTELTVPDWVAVGSPLTGSGLPMGSTMQLTQLSGDIPPKLFWRVAVSDIDDDSSGLTEYEQYQLSIPPFNTDTDGDGVPDVLEIARGTSPTLWDSDGDGYSDAVDAFPLDPTRHDPPASVSGDNSKPLVTLDTPSNAIYVSGP